MGELKSDRHMHLYGFRQPCDRAGIFAHFAQPVLKITQPHTGCTLLIGSVPHHGDLLIIINLLRTTWELVK